MRLVLTASVLLLLAVPHLPAQEAVRFAAIGDYGRAGQPELDVANLVASWSPDFVITLGDNNYETGSATTIDQNIGQYYHAFIAPYTGSYGAGDTVNRFFPSLGNHDWGTAGALPYRNFFTLPGNERYYDFARGPVHFFAIDSDTNEPDGRTVSSVQAQWLQAGLAAAAEPWKLVYFHHPPYSSGTVHGPTYVMRWPFEAWGATAVLAGHEHIYERILTGGIVYFTNGLGGRSLYPVGSPTAGSAALYNADYGAMLVTASSDSIIFEFRTRTDSLIDRYAIGLAPSAVAPEGRAAAFNLSQNYPNPFNPSTTLTVVLRQRSYMRLDIVNPLGEVIALLREGTEDAGEYRTTWDAGSLPTGVYWARLRNGTQAVVRKLLLVR